MTMQKIGNVLNGDHAKPVAPKVARFAPANPEVEARTERHLLELANKPLTHPETGEIIYHCQACKDMHFLRADVPFNHPNFGKVRVCPCSKQFNVFGAKWFAPSELYHQN